MTESQSPTTMLSTTADWGWVAFVAVVVFIVDHIAKYWAVTVLQYRPPIEVVPGVFYFGYGENTGIAFGLFQNHGGWLNFVVPAAFVCLIYLIYSQFADQKMDAWHRLIFGLLIGGALGNIVDRMVNGYVVDFIDVFIGTYHWPTFNIADSALSVGMVLMIGKLFIWAPEPTPDSASESKPSPSQTDQS